jgi:hypothetical protein
MEEWDRRQVRPLPFDRERSRHAAALRRRAWRFVVLGALLVGLVWLFWR